MKRLLALVLVAFPIALASAEEADSRVAVQATLDRIPRAEALYFASDSIDLRAVLFADSFSNLESLKDCRFGLGADFKLLDYGPGRAPSLSVGPAIWTDGWFSGEGGTLLGVEIKPLDTWRRVISKDFPLAASFLSLRLYADWGFSNIGLDITPVQLRYFL